MTLDLKMIISLNSFRTKYNFIKVRSLLMDSKTDASSTPSTSSDQKLTPHFLRVEWLGQTIASLCWITSMYFYGVKDIGDGLQLVAGLAWFIANLASLDKS